MTSPKAISSGKLAFLADKGALHPVRIEAAEGGRVTVAHLDGSTSSLAAARLYWVGATDVGPDTLTDVAEAIERLSTSAIADDPSAIASAWATLAGADTVAADTLARAVFGRDDAVACDACVAALFRERLHFRVRSRSITRVAESLVASTRARRAEDAAQRRRHALAVAAFEATLRGDPAPADDETKDAVNHFSEALIGYAVEGKEATHAAGAKALLSALGRRSDDAFTLLVELGIFDVHENLAVRRAGLDRPFDAATMDAARAVLSTAMTAPRDDSALLTVAIDDPDTREIDDAFAVDGDRLIVFIADAAAFVRSGGLVDAEARRRTSTVYLPDRKIPMLPPEIGMEAAALVAGAPRTALAFSFELDDDGYTRALDVYRTKVQVDHQLTYSAVNSLLTAPHEGAPDPLRALLRTASELMDRHRARRERHGAVFFQRNEVYLGVEDDGTIILKRGDPYGAGRQLVGELMVATCMAAAAFCAERTIPCIYRTQAPPDGSAMRGEVHDPATQVELLRRLKPTVLSTKIRGHFTLAAPAYAQVTSPLRRYSDLLMHQQLASYLRTGLPRYSERELAGCFDLLDRGRAVVRRIENDSKRYWALRYFEAHPGEVFEAHVVRDGQRVRYGADRGATRVMIEITALALQVPLTTRRRVAIGDPLRVRVAEVDPRADRLVLTIDDG